MVAAAVLIAQQNPSYSTKPVFRGGHRGRRDLDTERGELAGSPSRGSLEPGAECGRGWSGLWMGGAWAGSAGRYERDVASSDRGAGAGR
jgi:hypothetical protein